MSQYTIPARGIVAYSRTNWVLESLLTRAPGPDEFLLEVLATGVCHTDISGYGDIYPRVLGHEGAGRVLTVGSDPDLASRFRPGDLVILSAASCQRCLYCRTGHPAYCVDHAKVTLAANEPNFVLARGEEKGRERVVIGGGYFGQSTFASPTPVKASCAVNVTQLLGVTSVEELRAYAPLGCGIMTGAGAITHVGECGEEDVVAVVGLGGVGLAAVAAARERGVKTVIGVDLLASRVALAKDLGATHGLESGNEALEKAGYRDLGEAIRALTPEGLGCTRVLDTSPSVAVLGMCLQAVRKNGMVMQVGVKPVGAKLEVDLLAHMVNGRRLVGVIEGDRDPAEALPELVQWCREGVLPMGKLSRNYPVEEFSEATKAMEKGDVIKAVLVW